MSKEFKVGLIALFAGVTLYYGFNYLKGIDFFSSTNKYYVIYENVDGLTKSNPVIINGLTVGRVSRIQLKQEIKNQILVELDIDESLQLGDSTVAKLGNTDFLGSKGIILEVGPLRNVIAPGDTLISFVDKGIGQLLEDATPVANNLNVTISRINDILIGLKGSGEKINSTIDEVNQTMVYVNELIEANREDVSSLIASTNILVQNINTKVNQLTPLMNKANGVMDTLNNVRINETLLAIESLVENLDQTVTALQDEQTTIGRLMKDDSLYTNINQTMVDLDKLLIHMNNYPKHFFAPLGKSHNKIQKELNKDQ